MNTPNTPQSSINSPPVVATAPQKPPVSNHESKLPQVQSATPTTAAKAPAPTGTKPATPPAQPVTASSAQTSTLPPDKLARMEARFKADTAPVSTGQKPAQIAANAAPASVFSREPKPGYLPNGEPDHSPAGRRARLETEEENRRLEKEEREKRKRKPRPEKGEYVKKLRELEFEQLTDAEAKIAYELLTDRLVKASLRRSKPIKVLFTSTETDVLKRIARTLGIDATVKRPNLARIVRKLCFTGDASTEVLAVYKEIERELNRIGNNINQLMHYLNSKKPAFSEDMHRKFDAELRELRAHLAELERRVAR